MWNRDTDNRLYAVKRKNKEMYHCGSYSHATPKLYFIGHAKAAAKQLNKRYDPDKHSDKGEWIVVEVQFVTSEID